VTATLPVDVQQVFSSFVTTELTTIDSRGRPITWPVAPYYRPGADCIDVTTAIGFPKKARDAERNPKVSLLFSDATGSGLGRAPMVLVQGTAVVDDHDLDANRERYIRDSAAKLGGGSAGPPPSIQRRFSWYFTRIYMHIRPERVYVWPDGDPAREPELLDSHMEEVRSGHDEEPDVPHAQPEGGRGNWDARMTELGKQYPTAVLSIVAPDGFPFSARVPVVADRGGRVIRIDPDVTGAPMQSGLACLTAHEHEPSMRWHRSFQVRGDLVNRRDGWMLIPHRLVDGFELPRAGSLTRTIANFAKIRRFRKTAKREMSRHGSRA
jgi:hypothetical protein